MLLPIASIFSACGKTKNYDLSTLDDEFFSIEKENSNIELKDGVLAVNYANCSTEFRYVVSTKAPYTELKKYNEVFSNILKFTSLYIDECSNSSAKIDKEEGKQLHEKVENLKSSVGEMNECTDMLAEIIGLSYNDNVVDKVCLARYENLLKSYENVFEKASLLHDSISNLYFKKVLKNGNPNISQVSLSDFDGAIVANNLQARLMWQKSNLTQVFVEINVCGGTLSEEIAKNHGAVLDLQLDNYKANIVALENSLDAEEIANQINNLPSETKKQFYKLAIRAYNAQEVIAGDSGKFVYACGAIEFTNLFNGDEISDFNNMCYFIIVDYGVILEDYSSILQGMVNIINA